MRNFLYSSIIVVLALILGPIALVAQVPGPNVNMVSGTTLPNGDPFLQRQNEPSLAASTRNPEHLLGGANDYRTVDLPGLPDDLENGDAWVGVYKSTDGGRTWRSTLLPGFPQDSSAAGLRSPLHGFTAAADPTVRAGVNGVIFYTGIAFSRGNQGRKGSVVFIARYADQNNKESGDPFRYLGTSLVVARTDGFLDKPWLAVDQPRRGSTCIVDGKSMPAGNLYVAYTEFTGLAAGLAPPSEEREDESESADRQGERELRGRIMFTRSLDCGATWSSPMQMSSIRDVNQGATIAIDPSSGVVYVAWRQFADATTGTDDAIIVTHSRDGGRTFDLPVRVSRVVPFDQGTTPTSIRTSAFPTMTIDRRGLVYLAWAARGLAAGRPDPKAGDSRIVLSTSYVADGGHWTAPRAIDDSSDVPGHQIMPALAYAAGRIQLAYYDLREDHSQVFEPYLDDYNASMRHTIDVRTAQAIENINPVFTSYSVTTPRPSYRVSDYAFGSRPGGQDIEQLEFNAPNLPLFKQGTVPFLGDYIDVAPAPAFIVTSTGQWVFNTLPQNAAVFHVAWTDNRDVTPPHDGNWANYTPPTQIGAPLNGAQAPACSPGQEGMRNQNVYTSRISTGLSAGSPGNTKPLSQALQRSFVVFARNDTYETRSYRLAIANQPQDGRASFAQFPLPPYGPASPPPQTVDYVTVPPLSMAARTVYATSSDASARIDVAVAEVPGLGQLPLPGSASTFVTLNADRLNPAITNPAITNPAITNPDIVNGEVSNPAITNPAITNPAITNPAITNPDIENLHVLNPDIVNPAITNPAITNATVKNPAITNPAITNPDIANGALTDVTWQVSNTGNTSAAYSAKLFLTNAAIPDGFGFQLIVHKSYETPVAINCELKTESHDEVLVNLNDPTIRTQLDANALDPSDVTFVVNPGEHVEVTLRIIDHNVTDAAPIDVARALVPIVKAQAVNSDDAGGGAIVAPIVPPPSAQTIAFLVQPSAVTAGQTMTPPVTVRLLGLGGIPQPSQVVELSLAANPWGASLSGAIAATDRNGVATFSNLAVTLPGAGYQLIATLHDGGPTAISQPFTVLSPPGPSVDVAALSSHAPVAPVVGDALSFNVTVLNNAPTAATNVTLTDTLPAGVDFQSAVPSRGACSQAAGVVTCQLGTVANGDPVTIAIAVTPTRALMLTNQVAVSAIESDTNATNNIATDNVTVAPTVDGLIGLYRVLYRDNASGCGPGAPNPFNCSYLSGPVLVDPATTPAGMYRVDILQPLDPNNIVGGFRVWDGDPAAGTQRTAGEVFHHVSGNIYPYAHDWYPWDNPPGSGWLVGVYQLSTDQPTVNDTFEAPTLDSAWTVVNSGFGTIGLSTAQNTTPGGQQSLVFSSVSGGQRSMTLDRSLQGATQATVSVRFYDTAPGSETLYTNFELKDSATGISATLGVQDFDAFCYKAFVFDPGTNTNFGPNANCGIFPQASTTNVPRTAGWHSLAFRWNSQGVTLFIDDQPIFQKLGTFNFDKVRLDVSGPVWRPNATYYFDDFIIRP